MEYVFRHPESLQSCVSSLCIPIALSLCLNLPFTILYYTYLLGNLLSLLDQEPLGKNLDCVCLCILSMN
jgi:hypothetical protein